MRFDTFGAASHVSETVRAVDSAELANYVFSVGRNWGLLRELDGLGNNPMRIEEFVMINLRGNSLFINLYGVLVPEWRIASQKFIYQDSKRPPIDCCCVAF